MNDYSCKDMIDASRNNDFKFLKKMDIKEKDALIKGMAESLSMADLMIQKNILSREIEIENNNKPYRGFIGRLLGL